MADGLVGPAKGLPAPNPLVGGQADG